MANQFSPGELDRRQRAAIDSRVLRDFHALKVARLRAQYADAIEELACAEEALHKAEQLAEEARAPSLRRVA